MEELLKKLGISSVGYYARDGSYVVDISNSDEYGVFYSKLDNSGLLDEDEEASLLTTDNASVQFSSDDYQLTLIADFNQNLYKLVVKEI